MFSNGVVKTVLCGFCVTCVLFYGFNKSESERRRLSSDGQTPKPPSKMFKMAESVASNGESENFEIKMIDKMTIIAKAIENLQDGQNQLKSAFNSKLDKFRN